MDASKIQLKSNLSDPLFWISIKYKKNIFSLISLLKKKESKKEAKKHN